MRPKCVVRFTCDNSCVSGYHGVHICTANKHDKPMDNCLLAQDSFTNEEKIAALVVALKELTGKEYQPKE